MQNPNNKQYEYTVGILIYHRNQELVEMAKECLGSVLSSVDRKKTQIIVCDNGSTFRYDWDKHCDVYIRFNENMGISRGWNAILKNAKAKRITILGDDVIVSKGFLEGLRAGIEMPNAGVSNVYVEHLPQGKGIVEDYKWYSGACFMLTDETIEKVGYFDEQIFPANTEDWDYWIRVYQKGLKLYKNFHVSVQHKEGQTVHAPDISQFTPGLLKQLEKKCGFDPVPVFCSTKSIYDALSSVGKI